MLATILLNFPLNIFLYFADFLPWVVRIIAFAVDLLSRARATSLRGSFRYGSELKTYLVGLQYKGFFL